MLHLLALLAIWVVIAIIVIRSKVIKSDKGLMILGGSIIVAIVIASIALTGWGIWTLMQAQL